MFRKKSKYILFKYDSQQISFKSAEQMSNKIVPKHDFQLKTTKKNNGENA